MRWKCDGQQLPVWPARLPPVDESMLLVLEPLLIRLPSIALCMAIEEQNAQQIKKAPFRINGFSSSNHLPDKETFKRSHFRYVHSDLFKSRAALDSLYFLQFLGENKTFIHHNQPQALPCTTLVILSGISPLVWLSSTFVHSSWIQKQGSQYHSVERRLQFFNITPSLWPPESCLSPSPINATVCEIQLTTREPPSPC